jgi:Amt family ammonium transporter
MTDKVVFSADKFVAVASESQISMEDAVIPGLNMTWILVSGVIVFLMQSGFALLESGSVRFKNY